MARKSKNSNQTQDCASHTRHHSVQRERTWGFEVIVNWLMLPQMKTLDSGVTLVYMGLELSWNQTWFKEHQVRLRTVSSGLYVLQKMASKLVLCMKCQLQPCCKKAHLQCILWNCHSRPNLSRSKRFHSQLWTSEHLRGLIFIPKVCIIIKLILEKNSFNVAELYDKRFWFSGIMWRWQEMNGERTTNWASISSCLF